MVKNLPAMRVTWAQSLGWEDSLEVGMSTHSSILAWRIPHGQRSLVGYIPWGCEELDTTERLSTIVSKRKKQNTKATSSNKQKQKSPNLLPLLIIKTFTSPASLPSFPP